MIPSETTVNVEDLLAVLRGWSYEDSWNVRGIYIDTAESLIHQLVVGTDPWLLIKHAKHVGSNCCSLYDTEI